MQMDGSSMYFPGLQMIKIQQRKPVIVIPGWTSVVEGWIPLLSEWVKHRPVHYIETREKNFTKSPEGIKRNHLTMQSQIMLETWMQLFEI